MSVAPALVYKRLAKLLPYGSRFCITGSYALAKAPGFANNINILVEDTDELESWLKTETDDFTRFYPDRSVETGVIWSALTEPGNRLGLPKDISITLHCLVRQDYRTWSKANAIMLSLSYVSRPVDKAQRVSMFLDLIRYLETDQAVKAARAVHTNRPVEKVSTSKKRKTVAKKKYVTL